MKMVKLFRHAFFQNLFLVIIILLSFSCSKNAGAGFAPGSELSSVVSGSIQFSANASGDFGSTQAGSIVEKTIEISPVSSVSLTQVTSSAILPFKYKGGAYPGVGGTCGSTISSTCSIVLNFEPTAQGSFSNSLSFSYKVSGTSLNSSLSVSGSATLGAPTGLSITGSDSAERNQCVPFILNSIISSTGISSAVSSSLTVQLAVNSGSGAFYSDVACTLSVTSAIISSGQSTQTVYFKGPTAPQTPTLVVTSAGYSSGTKVITVASTPTRLLVSNPAQILVNDCRLISVSRLDNNGLDVASLSSTQVNLSQTGSMLFFSDSSCLQQVTSVTISSGLSSQNFYVLSTNVQSISLTASDQANSLSSSTKAISFVSSLQWWSTAFANRIQITLDNKDQAVAFSNQAVLIRLSSSIVAYSLIKSDGSDLRFVASDHTTVLSHEIESWDVNGYSYVWVKVPSISASSDLTIYMYFGNSAATSAEDLSGTWSRYSSVWHLKESASAAAPQFKDVGTASRNGTASNNPTSTTGVIGNGLDLSGALDAIDVGNLAPVLGDTATLSFWINTSMTGNNTNWMAPAITGVEQSGGVNDIFWGWIDGSGYIAVTAGNGTGAKSVLQINDNVWRHIAISRNATTGVVSFYVNGVLNNSGTSGTGVITTAFSKFGIVPKTDGSAAADFNGKIDEIRIETSVLNAEQIKADFKFQNANSQVSFGQLETY